MKDNQSLQITIIEPPNPKPIRSLGVFSSLSEPALIDIIAKFLPEIRDAPKSAKFLANVSDEIIERSIRHGTILTAYRDNGILYFSIKEGTR